MTWHDGSVPKIIGASLAEHRQNVRAKLFDALSELMTQTGFDGVTLADIATTAGVGRTSVYNHFPDKEALLIGLIEHETANFVVDLQQALEQVDDPREQLRIYVREQIRLKRSYHFGPGPDLRTVLSRPTVRRLRDHVVQVEDLLRGILQDGIAAGRLPDQDLEAVVPLINSCLTGRSVPETEPERTKAVAATEAFVMRAVGAGAVITAPGEVTLGA